MFDTYEICSAIDDTAKMLGKELAKMNEKKDINPTTLGHIGDILDGIKDAVEINHKIDEMERGGYSESGYPRMMGYAQGDWNAREPYMGNNSYARGQKRDSMGRYARNGYGGSYGGYSGNDKAGQISQLEQMMNNATNEAMREQYRQLIMKLENE